MSCCVGFGWRPAVAAGQVSVAPVVAAAESATTAPASGGGQVTFEDTQVGAALARLSLAPDLAPEGKRVAFVRVVRRDVFQEGELWFDWLVWFNNLHVLTKEDVVRRELRVREGAPYRAAAAAETARNLRALGIFTLVRLVAVQTGQPDTVGVLVYTRDLWSLRLETDPEFTETSFQLLTQLTERNLLGRNKTATIRVDRRPLSFSVGQVYHDYRLGGGRLQLVESGDLFFNNATWKLEGGKISARLERPFYNLDQRWSFALSGGFVDVVHRNLQGGEVSHVELEGQAKDCDPRQPSCVPFVYDRRTGHAQATVRYRIGHAYRQTFSGGLVYSDGRLRANAETGLVPEWEGAFAEKLPRTRRQVAPFVRYGLFVPRYARFKNLASYGRTETVNVGPGIDSTMLFPIAALGSDFDAFRADGTLGYTVAGFDALLSAKVSASARLEQGRVIDQQLSFRLRGATPPWLLGRLVWQGTVVARRRDTSQTFVTLGNDSGLRGYGAGYAKGQGASWMLSNLEYRTLPADIESVHVGAAFFYDVGSVYDRLSAFEGLHSVGAGLRVLFPQLNRHVFRFDVGVPVGGRGGFDVRFSIGGSQVVPLTPEEDRIAEKDIRSL